ncbi:elongation factor G, partial [Emiliania huxleyi CCMP1516]|uniref:Elongation factor EFG domain-containing protein n=2 Tax=Emiliania huxleyi TaxID=2903 RepID=A0A0D3K3D3_EMIH1
RRCVRRPPRLPASRGARRGLEQEAVAAASPVLLEPVMRVEVQTAEQHLGAVLSELTGAPSLLDAEAGPACARRGSVEKLLTPSDALRQTVLARAPLAAMVGYASALRSLTAGEASLSMEFSHYARVEPAVQQQLLLQMRGYV